MPDLRGKVALVTGAGRGIGRRIALRFAEAGSRVVAVARTAAELESAAAEAPDPKAFQPIPADVSLPEDVRRVVRTALEQFGPVNILVNNAAIYLEKPIVDTTPEEWERVFQVNALGPFLLTREVLPDMLRRDEGRIINICSTASHRAYRNQSAYCASKHALLGFTRVLAEETRGTNVRVHAISPGGVNTSLVAGRPDVDWSQYMDPDEIAEIALFLASMERIATVDEVVVRRMGGEPFR